MGSKNYVDCEEIEPGLWLGNINAATDVDFLKQRAITHVVTAYIYPVVTYDKVTTMFIEVEDSFEANIIEHFDEACAFIENAQRVGACLVHCYAGQSRSAAIVTAYLMKKYQLGFTEALARLRQKRYHAYPNGNFEHQLKIFEEMGCKLNKQYPKYKLFQMEQLSNQMMIRDVYESSRSFVANPDTSISIDKFKGTGDVYETAKLYASSQETNVSGDRFKCKYCRKYLFSEANIFPHSLLRTDTSEKSDTCNDVYFVDVLPWMSDAFKDKEGKILCKYCHSKLGTFAWQRRNCKSCGASMDPSFIIVPSNVDRENFPL